MIDTLVCIELPGQIQHAMKVLRQREITQYSILALTPHVGYALEKMGLPYHSPEDYHTEDEINNVGLEDLSKVERFCTMLDQNLLDRWELLKEHRINPANLSWYQIKTLFNSVSIRAFIGRRVIESETPKEVIYFETDPELVSEDLFFVHESAWSSTIPAVCAALDVACHSIKVKTDPAVLNTQPKGRSQSFKSKLKHLVRRNLGDKRVDSLRGSIHTTRNFVQASVSAFRRGNYTSRSTVLFTATGYSVGKLLQHVRNKNEFNVLYWDPQKSQAPAYINPSMAPKVRHYENDQPSCGPLEQRGKQVWSQLELLSDFKAMFCFSGVDCYSVVQSRLKRLVELSIPEMVRSFFVARSLAQTERPFAMVEAVAAGGKIQAAALAAKQAGIPIVVYRHGSSSGFTKMETAVHDVIEHVELEQADHVLALGEGEVEYLEKRNPTNTQIIPIGSAVLDTLRNGRPTATRDTLHRRFGLDPSKRTVIYVPTMMHGNIRVTPYANPSPTRMFELQRRIVELFEEFPDVQLVAKLPPSNQHPTSPIVRVIQDRGWKNVAVITEPFLSVLGMADMFITDFPSTPFVEMLTTDKPILVCGQDFPTPWAPGVWHPSVLEMWKERVAYADDLEGFLDMVRSFIREDRFQPVNSNNTMLKLFGTHLDDGKSVERAYEFLRSLAHQLESSAKTVATTAEDTRLETPAASSLGRGLN